MNTSIFLKKRYILESEKLLEFEEENCLLLKSELFKWMYDQTKVKLIQTTGFIWAYPISEWLG